MIDFQPMPPNEAIAFFEQKGFKTSFAWQDVWQEEHAKAFTVAKMMQRDLLEDTHQALSKAMKDGQTFEQFRKELAPKLKAKGWWGKQEMTDPKTGEVKNVQLGSARRLRTIYDTNMRTSYAHGQWQRIEATKARFPYLMYDAVNDNRTRPEHKAWDKICLPVDHEFWDTHYPPCGWHCRCDVLQFTNRMIDSQKIDINRTPPMALFKRFKNNRTGEILEIENGIDAGFNYNVGKSPLRGLSPRSMPIKETSKKVLEKAKEASNEFLKLFNADKKAKIIKDKNNWPLVISKALFLDAAGNFAIPKLEDFAKLPIIANALKNYDAAEWVWDKDKNGQDILIRRYTKHLDNQTITIDFTKDIWSFYIQ